MGECRFDLAGAGGSRPHLPRELQAFSDQAFDPGLAALIGFPVLALVWSDSSAEIKVDREIVAACVARRADRGP